MTDIQLENERALQVALDAIDRFPWHQPKAYAGWLAQTYHYAAWTVSLLSLMAARTNIKLQPDMHRARLVHSNEEVGHDQWLRDDLAALGYDLADFPELPVTRMFWEPQFAKPDLYGVESIYGYTIILEQLATLRGDYITQRVKGLAGDRKCDRFISAHSTEDIGHVDKDMALIRKFPPALLPSVADNMLQTAVGYSRMLETIEEAGR